MKMPNELRAKSNRKRKSKLTAGQAVLALAAKARQGIPFEERARIPRDASINLDHYLYGVPKLK
jgi:hypothetical protein